MVYLINSGKPLNRLRVGLIILFFAGIVLAFSGLVWGNFSLWEKIGSYPNDFSIGYQAARDWLLNGISPYDSTVVQNHADRMGLANTTGSQYQYPVYAIILWVPFALMDFPAAQALWSVAQELILMITILLAIRLSGWKLQWHQLAIVLFIVFIWPSHVFALLDSGLAIWSLFFIVFALYMLINKQDNAAGLLMAMAMVKPEMALLPLVGLIMWSSSSRRNGFLGGFVAGFLFLNVLFMILIPDWVLQWLRISHLLDGTTSWYQSGLNLIADSMPGIRQFLMIALNGGMFIYLVAEWARMMGKPERMMLWTMALTLMAVGLISFDRGLDYHTALLPGYFLVFRILQERWGKLGTWMIIGFVIILFVGPWVLVGINETNIHLLVLLLPAFCWLLLGWFKWWAIRSTRLLISYEEELDL